MINKKILPLFLSLVLLVFVSGCGDEGENTKLKEDKITGTHHAVITVEKFGEIEIELYGDKAPITVKNFMDLANEGFYDGLTFHRIIENRVCIMQNFKIFVGKPAWVYGLLHLKGDIKLWKTSEVLSAYHNVGYIFVNSGLRQMNFALYSCRN